MLRYGCRTRMAEAHLSAMISLPLSANQDIMRCPCSRLVWYAWWLLRPRYLVLHLVEWTLNVIKMVTVLVRLFFSTAQQPLVVQDLPIIEASRSHSVGLLWTRGQPVSESYTLQHTTHSKDRHECPRRDSNPQSRQASGLRSTLKTARPLGWVTLIFIH